MEHESPIMKAWREFALADPNDCDREWEAYLALVNKTGTASGSSPTNSTSSLAPAAATRVSPTTSVSARPRVPGNAAPIANPTAAAASRAVLSAKHDSPKGDLTPEARRIYDFLVGGSSTPASTAPLRVPSSSVPIGGISERAAATPSSTSASAICTTPPVAATSASTSTHVSRPVSPEARRIYDYLVGNSAAPPTTDVSTNLWVRTELDVVHDAVNADKTDLTAPTPTICSSECPSKDAPASMSTTICDVVPELVAPAVSDKALDVDARSDTTTTVVACLPAGPDHNICGEDLVSMSLTLWSAPTSFNSLPENSPSLWLARLDVLESCMWSPVTCSTIRSGHSIDTPPSLLAEAYNVFNDVFTAIVPWPPPSWTRARPPLICGQDLFNHAQQKRCKEFSVQDTKSNWHANWLDVELKPPWPSLGVCMNLPMGYPLFFLGSITVNDNTSPDANWCLDDVLWKLPRWWSHTQYVQPANEILYVSSWPWVASKHADMLFQFSNPLLPVNCDLARVHFLLSGTAQINVRSPCEASLNLVVYCEYPSLNIAHTHSWMLIIVGHHLQYGLEADALLLLIFWLPVPCLQFCVVQGYPSSKGFLAIFNGEAVVQQSYTWTISLVPLKSWFQCCRAGRESLYSSENFQWAIAWSLSYHFSLTILQTRPHCSILLVQLNCPAIYQQLWFRILMAKPISPAILLMIFLDNCCGQDVELCLLNCAQSCSSDRSQWEIAWLLVWSPRCLLSLSISWSFSCSLWEDWLLPCSTRRVFLSSSGKCILEIAGLLNLALPDWETWTSGVYFWTNYLRVSACGPDVPMLLWLQFAIEEFYSNIKIGKLHDFLVELDTYSRSLHYLEVRILDATFTRLDTLQASTKLYWLLGLHYSSNQFVTATHPPSKAQHLPWDPGDCFVSSWRQDNFGRVADGCSCPRIDTSQVPWDPGRLSGDRLGGKPNFKGGGLSATCLQGLGDGPPHWAMVWLEARCRGDRGIYTKGATTTRRGLERNGLDGGFGRGPGLACVLRVLLVPLLPP